MYIYPKTNIQVKHQLKNISSDEFLERARELANESNGIASFMANKLYVRKKNSLVEHEAILHNNTIVIESSLLSPLTLIIRLQIIMFFFMILVGYNNSTIIIMGLTGYIILTFLTNYAINKESTENYKLIRSLDYD